MRDHITNYSIKIGHLPSIRLQQNMILFLENLAKYLYFYDETIKITSHKLFLNFIFH